MSSNFTDIVTLTLRSGAGGNGKVSFRREKFIPLGGPDGGDGGDGGDVVVISSKDEKTLRYLRKSEVISASNGEHGKSFNRHGKRGKDIIIQVPIGTVLKDLDGNTLHQFIESKEKKLLLKGGRGGRGNTFFKNSVRRAPKFAQQGEIFTEITLIFELELIADFGFVGMPNVGKSTLLQKLTHANPKIGNYPFTTLIPNLGTLTNNFQEIVLADIPGLIEGASSGHGLGTSFLKHIKKSMGLVFVLDASNEDLDHFYLSSANTDELLKKLLNNIIFQYKILVNELQSFDTSLMLKHKIIVISKIDLIPLQDEKILIETFISNLRNELAVVTQDSRDIVNLPIHCVSSFTQEGIESLKDILYAIKIKELGVS